MPIDVDEFRYEEMARIQGNRPRTVIQLESLPKDVEYGFLDDIYDVEGDSIMATPRLFFPRDGEGLVRAEFERGTDPRYAARILRKYAALLEGRHGYAVANMGLGDEDLNMARRTESGDVVIYNVRKQRELEDNESDDDDDD